MRFSPEFVSELQHTLDAGRPGHERIVNLIHELAGRRIVSLLAAPGEVLTPDELVRLEQHCPGWASTRAVWRFARPGSSYEHKTAIRLGQQLSARYPRQVMRGPTRHYWIEAPTIDSADA